MTELALALWRASHCMDRWDLFGHRPIPTDQVLFSCPYKPTPWRAVATCCSGLRGRWWWLV